MAITITYPKLTANQAKVLRDMQQTGHVLANSDYTQPRLVDQATDGTGVDSETISRATFSQLHAKGCLRPVGRKFPVTYYSLTNMGKGALAAFDAKQAAK